MKTIFKYTLPVEDEFKIKSFYYFIPLSIQLQDGIITLWAEVDTESVEIEQTFYCYGTGHAINESGIVYIGTVQQKSLVWHYFHKIFKTNGQHTT